MAPDSYILLELTVEPDFAEVLTGMLTQLGFEGFWEDGPTLRCYMSERRWDDRLAEEVEQAIRLLLPTGSRTLPSFRIERIAEQNWNEQWERSIQPILLTADVMVAPTWQPCDPAPGSLLIRIDPKMAFGTGYHESTRLAATLLRQHIRQSASVLDLGTGTGILAILAVKSGASHALGADIDEWSFLNAQENVRINGCEDRVTILQGGLEAIPPGRFGLVVANIQLTVIAGLLADLRDRLDEGGILILSGLLASESEEIAGLLGASGLELLQQRAENDWTAVSARLAPR